MSFTKLDIKTSYVGEGKDILKAFLLPTLESSIRYDRITGYYSIDSLLAISQGIEYLFEKGGKMRLIIGAHSVPGELIDATLNKNAYETEINHIREDIKTKISSLSDSLEKKRIATIAWMIEDGLLTVKTAKTESSGIFHPKTLLFSDEENNEIVAVGSSNETRNGLGDNFEQLMIAKSWDNIGAVNDQKAFFESLWENKMPGVIVNDITSETEAMIKEALGNGYKNPHHLAGVKSILSVMAKMPANFFVSGDIPSLYMHQERAVIDALSRWPIRVLLADEVGLGKTFEAAAVLSYLVKYCGIKRVLILTPKSVLQQWQDELFSNFNLNTWLYNSEKKQYLSARGKTITIGEKNPIGIGSPDLVLMSAQFARGYDDGNGIFATSDAVLPELLIIDEAHSARVTTDLSGKKKKTQMYKMVEEVAKKIPHLILATATPMQKEASEYHAMLKLLGLPYAWEKEENYELSLKFLSSNTIPDNSDALTAAKLLHSTITQMSPSLSQLSEDERKLVSDFELTYSSIDNYAKCVFITSNWDTFRRAFIKLHPARLLTARNTRRSLIQVGYKFPKRNLKEINLNNSHPIELFYEKVDEYLATQCFMVEKSLHPEKKINIGFVRISYQQRVASSLYSCKKSLNNRFIKIANLSKKLDELTNTSDNPYLDFDISSLLDDNESDELFESGESLFTKSLGNDIDLNDLKRSVAIEYTALNDLLSNAQILLQTVGDKKIVESINLCNKTVEQGDSVLLFSRYTDTVDALVKEYSRQNSQNNVPYAIYTGSTALIVHDGLEEQCDKNRIKRELFNRNIRIVFCSDAASEGLNLQAARVLINVDVPWTPARLEQRIGRIARLGQIADEVDIFNVWYPNSVEAKMYHRIQTRLKNTNIAIGEFPDLLAESIKNAVLKHETDNSNVQELNNIRNSTQTEALEKLWTKFDEMITVSDAIRKQLITLCDTSFKNETYNKRFKQRKYDMPDGKEIVLSELCGFSESISLTSLPWKYLDFSIPSLKIETVGENASCFCDMNNRRVKFEKVLDLINGSKLCESDYFSGWPKTLPNMKMLDLSYAIDITPSFIGKLWVDSTGDDNEPITE